MGWARPTFSTAASLTAPHTFYPITHRADAALPEVAATAAAAEAAPLLFEARLRAEGDRAAVRGALLGAWDGGAAPGAAAIATGYTGRRPGVVIAPGGGHSHHHHHDHDDDDHHH